jgi:hypothetical protein
VEKKEKINSIGKLSLACSKHSIITILIIILITLSLLPGLTKLEFAERANDLLPRGNPNTFAAYNVSDQFPMFYNYVRFDVTIDPEKWEDYNKNLPYRITSPDKNNITDEVYIRGTKEFYDFVKERIPQTEFMLAGASTIETVNWSNSAIIPGLVEPDPSAFSMPGTDRLGEVLYAYDWSAIASEPDVKKMFSPDYKSTYFLCLCNLTGATQADRYEVGEKALNALEEYKQWAPEHSKFGAFDMESIALEPSTVITDTHGTDLTTKDNSILFPLVIIFIVICLFFAFRNLRSIIAAFVTFIIGIIWTLGIMGYIGIPFSALNMSIIPLILGVGIDYAIHMNNEFLEHKKAGLSDPDAFKITGSRAGIAMLVATLTTVSGLIFMTFSPCTMMVQLGIVASIGISIIYLLTISFIPASLTLVKTKGMEVKFKPSRVMHGFAKIVGNHKIPFIIIVIILSVFLGFYSTTIKTEIFGNPEDNFPEGDKVREWRKTINLHTFGEEEANYVYNFFIIEGDITQPAIHDYLRALESNLYSNPNLTIMNFATIVTTLEGYKLIEYGSMGAPLRMVEEAVEPGITYPKTSEELRQTLDDIFSSPYATNMGMFIPKENYIITVTPFNVQENKTFADVERVWNELWKTARETEEEVPLPPDTYVSLYGQTAFSYLFIKYEVPWIQYLGIVACLACAIIIACFTRKLKATLTVVAVMGLTTLWWFGFLPLINIGLSISLLLPIVFIMGIGSDYIVHLVWNIRQTGDPDLVFSYVGKAVLFSAITTLGAFAIFSFQSNIMGHKTMLAVVVAIALIFLCTILIAPLAYMKKKKKA